MPDDAPDEKPAGSLKFLALVGGFVALMLVISQPTCEGQNLPAASRPEPPVTAAVEVAAPSEVPDSPPDVPSRDELRAKREAERAALRAEFCTPEMTAGLDEIAYQRDGESVFIDDAVWGVLMVDVKTNMLRYWHLCHRGQQIKSAQSGKNLAHVTWSGGYEIDR